MAIDLTQSADKILVDLINDTNGTALTVGDISFSPPQVLLNGGRNTIIQITAKPTSPYTGSRLMTYDRLDMDSVPGPRSRSFTAGQAKITSDLIAQINDAYLTNFQPEDFYNDPLPTLISTTTGSRATFGLRATPTSLPYHGTMNLTIVNQFIDLSTLLYATLLNGFVIDIGNLLSVDLPPDFTFSNA